MISKIGVINQINFQARIKIQKEGFKNIIEDVKGSAKIGARTVGSASSGTAEVTSFPTDISSYNHNFSAIRYNADIINKESDAISTRDLRTIISTASQNSAAKSKKTKDIPS